MNDWESSITLLSGACFIAYASIVIAGMITNASIAEGEVFCQVCCDITKMFESIVWCDRLCNHWKSLSMHCLIPYSG